MMDIARPRTLADGLVPPQRFDIDEFVLRRWRIGDAQAQVRALAESFEHLHAWLPWATTPATLEVQRALLAEWSTGWPHNGEDFLYGLFDATDAVLGGMGLHERGSTGTVEIGYWGHVAHGGRGVITRAVVALTDSALALPGVDRVRIRCDVANLRSAAVARRAGYRLDHVEAAEPATPAQSGQMMIWVRDRV
ncbi:GNAT family N-acetyltransferase [Nocardia takedensis]|uniref:GNAT family N-acetyltransferase n=1 Tax=Nocardia takedensis TaxID=259390 RepID=UPI003F7660DE